MFCILYCNFLAPLLGGGTSPSRFAYVRSSFHSSSPSSVYSPSLTSTSPSFRLCLSWSKYCLLAASFPTPLLLQRTSKPQSRSASSLTLLAMVNFITVALHLPSPRKSLNSSFLNVAPCFFPLPALLRTCLLLFPRFEPLSAFRPFCHYFLVVLTPPFSHPPLPSNGHPPFLSSRMALLLLPSCIFPFVFVVLGTFSVRV